MDTGTPYANMEPESGCKKCLRKTKKCVLGTCCVAILLVCLVQAAIYKWATLKCSAAHLKDYEYPGGGEKNLVPWNSLLIEQDPRWWGSSFINIPSDDAGLAMGASSGVYFKTSGPIFNTYTYQDIMSRETFVIRDRPLALGGSHKIMRCDGTGPSYVFSEGTHLIMNNIRELFGMYTTRQYNIWEGNKKVAISEKVGGSGQSHKQIIFRAPDEDTPFSSCFLKDRRYHGQYDEWFVEEAKNQSSALPAFVPHSCCVLMAFRTSQAKAAQKAAQDKKSSEAPKFLSASNEVELAARQPESGSADFAIEAGEAVMATPEAAEATDMADVEAPVADVAAADEEATPEAEVSEAATAAAGTAAAEPVQEAAAEVSEASNDAAMIEERV